MLPGGLFVSLWQTALTLARCPKRRTLGIETPDGERLDAERAIALYARGVVLYYRLECGHRAVVTEDPFRVWYVAHRERCDHRACARI